MGFQGWAFIQVVLLGVLYGACSVSTSSPVRVRPKVSSPNTPAVRATDLDAKRPGNWYATGSFFPLIGSNAQYVVLSESPGPAELAAGVGHADLLDNLSDNPGLYASRRRVDASRLPVAVRRWKGKTLALANDQRVVCEARIGNFALVSGIVPHVTTRYEWEGRDGNGGFLARSAPVAPRQIAEAIAAKGHTVLVASLGQPRGTCAAASWAGAVKPQQVVPFEKATDVLRESALRRLRALPGYAKVQRRFLEETKETAAADRTEHWDAFGNTALRAWVAKDIKVPGRSRRRMFVFAVASAGGEPCSDDFVGALYALWQVDEPGGRWTARESGELGSFETLRPVAVIDGDGSVIFSNDTGEDLRVHRLGNPMRTAPRFPDYDCPC